MTGQVSFSLFIKDYWSNTGYGAVYSVFNTCSKYVIIILKFLNQKFAESIFIKSIDRMQFRFSFLFDDFTVVGNRD